MTFCYSTVWRLKSEIHVYWLNLDPSHVLIQLLRHLASLKDKNCRLTSDAMGLGGRYARDALFDIFKTGMLRCGKTKPPNSNIFITCLRTQLKVMMLLLTPVICRISLRLCQWLAWKVWWHEFALVTYDITPGIGRPTNPTAART